MADQPESGAMLGDEIDATRGYVLGAGDDFYGVWDRSRPNEPLARFPFDDDGYARAQAMFQELALAEQRRRDVGPLVLTWAVGVGASLWALAEVVAWIVLHGPPFLGSAPEPGLETFAEVLEGISSVAFRVWVGSLSILVAVWLVRMARLYRGGSVREAAPSPAAAEGDVP